MLLDIRGAFCLCDIVNGMQDDTMIWSLHGQDMMLLMSCWLLLSVTPGVR